MQDAVAVALEAGAERVGLPPPRAGCPRPRAGWRAGARLAVLVLLAGLAVEHRVAPGPACESAMGEHDALAGVTRHGGRPWPARSFASMLPSLISASMVRSGCVTWRSREPSSGMPHLDSARSG